MRLALGTAQFGLPYGIANHDGQVTRSAAKKMLQLAATSEVDMIQGFKVITKLPALPDGCAISDWVQEQVAASLSRLGVSTLHGLLLHRPQQLLGVDGNILYETMQGLKETGRVKKLGISIYAPSELDLLTPRYHFDLVQAPFNLVDRRLHTSGWLQRLKDAGIEIHTRSAFLQGLLLMPPSAIPEKFASWSDLFSRWHSWIAHDTALALQACLAYPLSFPEIDRVVVGAESLSQLDQIINAANRVAPVDLPDLHCDAENLINPARWCQS
jgi:aryl-alcohol dehydrogenase-like predicted oxidoreductase